MKPQTLLRLYPRAWRERYGEEMVALLDESGVSIRIAVNLIVGALRERGRESGLVLGARAFHESSCPSCAAVIGRDEWFQFWSRYSVVDGSVIRPCGACGSLLRMSSTRGVERSFIFVAMTAQVIGGVLQISEVITRRTHLYLQIVFLAFLIAAALMSDRTRLESVPVDYGEVAQ